MEKVLETMKNNIIELTLLEAEKILQKEVYVFEKIKIKLSDKEMWKLFPKWMKLILKKNKKQLKQLK